MEGRAFRGLVVLAAMVGNLAFGACDRSLEDRLAEIRAMHRSRQIEESIPLLIELIESGVEDGEVYYRYGRALGATGHSERSMWALDAAMEDPKWRVRAGQQIAIDAQRTRNLELGLSTLERLANERPEGEEIGIPELLLHARFLVETNRRYEEALGLVDEVLKRSPKEDEALRLKAAALLGLERPDDAFELIRSAGLTPEEIPSREGSASGDDADDDSESIAQEDAQKEEKEEEELADPTEHDADERESYWCSIKASFQRESGEVDKAAAVVDECLARHPTSIALINEAMKVHARRKPGRILEILKSAYEASGDDPEVRRVLVKAYESSGRFEDAEAVLRGSLEALRADPENRKGWRAVGLMDLAGFLIARGRIDEALGAFDEMRELIGNDLPPALQLRYADTLVAAGRYDEALAISERSPVEIHRAMLRGRIAFERGQYADARKMLDEAALHWPDNGPIRYYLARSSEGLGDFDRAIEEYRQAIRSDVKLVAARERLIRLHLAEGKTREAAMIMGFRSPKEESQPSVAMRIFSVEIGARRGRDVELDFPLEPGADRESVRRDAFRAMSRGLRTRLGPSGGASALETVAAKMPPELMGLLVRERIDLMLEAGEVDEAVEIASKADVARGGDPNVQVALGRALLRQSTRKAEGEALLRRARDQRPGDPEIWRAIGEAAASRGDSAEASRCWEEALRLAPDDWLAMKLRVEQLVQGGQRDEAIRRLKLFLDRDAPYSGEAALVLATLEADDPGRRAEAAALTLRAIRFGGGAPAIELLSRLDPVAAAQLEPQLPAAGAEDESPRAGSAPEKPMTTKKAATS